MFERNSQTPVQASPTQPKQQKTVPATTFILPKFRELATDEIRDRPTTSLLTKVHPQSVKSIAATPPPASPSLPSSSTSSSTTTGQAGPATYGSRPISISEQTALAQGLPLDVLLPMKLENGTAEGEGDEVGLFGGP